MENKLELKHLIDSYKHQDYIYGASEFWKIYQINENVITLFNGLHYNDVHFKHFHLDYSIMKRPLHQLTTEIEHNGEKFVPMDRLEELYQQLGYDRYSIYFVMSHPKRMPYEIVEYLLSLYFDIDGFIKKKLAIELK